MRFFLGTAIVFAYVAHATCFASVLPSFDEYPAAVERLAQLQNRHPVLFDETSRHYAAVIRSHIRDRPNFAGHYVLITIGCGAGCIATVVFDKKDKKVVSFPYTVCCWPLEVTEPLNFQVNSRLLKVEGKLNESGDLRQRFYDFDGKAFLEVK